MTWIRATALLALVIVSFIGLEGSAPPLSTPEILAENPVVTPDKSVKADRVFRFRENDWVDSVYEALSDSQRLGQLFMVAAFSTTDKADPKLEKLVRDYNLGGLIFMKGSPLRQAQLTNHYQTMAATPMLIAMDAEWGLAMRLDSTQRYPYQITLGAMRDPALIYQMGNQIADQCKALGVHISFSPVVDVNNNAQNPVIGHRSFGESKYIVANRAALYMQGLQDKHIIACAKHFPGHGDTDADSHYALPVIKSSKKRLDSLELYPFRHLIQSGVASVMVAHLSVPALDDDPKTASTLSKPIVTDLLKNKLGFKGLIFTDALNMKGVADLYPPGEVDALALLAGNDILLYSMDVPTAINRIRQAITDDRITWRQLEGRIKKILAAKYWVGLHEYRPIDTNKLYAALNPDTAASLQLAMYGEAVTLLRDETKWLPLKNLPPNTLYVAVGDEKPAKEAFEAFAMFQSVSYLSLPMKPNAQQWATLDTALAQADTVVMAWHLPSQKAGVLFGLDTVTVENIRQRISSKKLVQLVYGNPYSFKYLDFGQVLVCGYEEHPQAFKATTNALFGSARFKGLLPVGISEQFKVGSGLRSDAGWNLRWSTPAAEGFGQLPLRQLDSLLELGLRLGAYPGAQLMVTKGQAVVYARAVGQGGNGKPNSLTTLYDLASITKIAATASGLMDMHQQGRLPIDSGLGYFLPDLKYEPIGRKTLREILTHQAGLPAFLPFWKNIKGSNGQANYWLRKSISDSFPIPLTDSLFARIGLKDSLKAWIRQVPLSDSSQYRYSDLGYAYLWEILQKHWDQTPEKRLQIHFFHPAAATSLGYLPRNRFPKNRIAPTENDQAFRQQLVHGYVHDQQAAMAGGIAGHAGLFGTAGDLARLYAYQLGYGRQAAIAPATYDLFTSPQFVNNRRGLAFDRPPADKNMPSPTAPSASGISFGHSGFTGTYVWIDPQQDLVFIFLANRIHPSVNNNKLVELNLRTQLQEAVYQAMLTPPTAR